MSTSHYESSPPTPTEKYLRRRNRFGCGILIVILIILALFISRRCRGPESYRKAEEHFKYGSIGSDTENGLPIELIKVLPGMFPQYLPEKTAALGDLRAFGFLREPGKELPIGFSINHEGIRLAGLNCASCHTGVVRDDPSSPGEYVPGMPANQLRLQQFFGFFFDCVSDPGFTAAAVVQAMRKSGYDFAPGEETLYKQVVIPQFQATLLLRRDQIKELFSPTHPPWGAGRVDTFNPYKRIQFAEYYQGKPTPPEQIVGTADYPSLWNQRIRDGLELHWDGNNSSVFERNLSASFGAGATRDSVDLGSIRRLQSWMMDLEPPRFEDYFGSRIDRDAAGRGQSIFRKYCFDCHDPKGKRIGKVEPLAEIGTSPYRFNSYTKELAQLQLDYGQGYSWQWKHFKKTIGYANMPLDGIWARAPYLHNGSIPTMWALLTPEKDRSSESFKRGHGVMDTKNLGIRTDVEEAGGLPAWEYVIIDPNTGESVPGNSNRGHTGKDYGTELSDAKKWDLVEFLKTL